jgi:uncharacterized membrane protein YsdA (DUF1294 family)
MLYTIIKMVCIIACAIIGLLMAIAPQKVVKQAWRENEAKLKQSRLLGALLVIICVVILV